MLRVHQKLVLALATVFIVALFSLANQVRGFSRVEQVVKLSPAGRVLRLGGESAKQNQFDLLYLWALLVLT